MTSALATAPDEANPEIVSERQALRDELQELRRRYAGVVRLDPARKRGPA